MSLPQGVTQSVHQVRELNSPKNGTSFFIIQKSRLSEFLHYSRSVAFTLGYEQLIGYTGIGERRETKCELFSEILVLRLAAGQSTGVKTLHR